jgi:hypothetical protein
MSSFVPKVFKPFLTLQRQYFVFCLIFLNATGTVSSSLIPFALKVLESR